MALSLSLPVAAPARLMMLGGLAALSAVDWALGDGAADRADRAVGAAGCQAHPLRIGLKWPNDVLVDGRKIAGVLVEVVGDAAIVGIGINVAQREFPPELAPHATSVALLGITVERHRVAAAAVAALARLHDATDGELRRRFQSRDVLRGTLQHFDAAGAILSGEVLAVDPLGSIRVRRQDGEVVEIDAAVARLLSAARGESPDGRR